MERGKYLPYPHEILTDSMHICIIDKIAVEVTFVGGASRLSSHKIQPHRNPVSAGYLLVSGLVVLGQNRRC